MDADTYAAVFATDLNVAQETAPRSLQRELGISDIGTCHQLTLYKLRGTPASDFPPGWAALMGSAVHAALAQARGFLHPELLHEQRLVLTLPSGYSLTGTADEIDPTEPSVTDFKTRSDRETMAYQRRTGSTEQQRFQRHMYGAAALQQGFVPQSHQAELIVRNVYVDRSGHEQPLVEQEPYSSAVVVRVDEWLSDVLYALEHGEDASRDKAYGWCRSYCPFFSVCRTENDESFMLGDPDMIIAVEMFAEHRKARLDASRVEEAAKDFLEPLTNQATGGLVAYETPTGYRFRAMWINGGEKRKGYWKYDVEGPE